MTQIQILLVTLAMGCEGILLVRALCRIETLRARVRELEAGNRWAPFDETEDFWGRARCAVGGWE